MKIWMIHHYAMPPHLSGVTRHFTLAKEMQKRGHQSYIVSASAHHKNSAIEMEAGTTSQLEICDDVPFLWLKTLKHASSPIRRVLNMLVFMLRVMQAMLIKPPKEIEKPDIIMGCTPEPFSALSGLILSWRYRCPFALHLGDIWPRSLVEIGGISRFHPFVLSVGLLEHLLYRMADVIITPLPTADKHIIAKGGKAEKIAVVPNGVDISLLPAYQPAKEGKEFKVYFAGAHGPANGLDAVLSTAKKVQEQGLKTAHFYLIGDGPEKRRLQKRRIDEAIENVTFLDPVAKTEIYPVLQQADAFIMNYPDLGVFRDGGISPNKIYDYMGMGRPVIIGCPAPSNPVMEARAGLSSAGDDIEGMAASIATLVKMPLKERQEIGKRAHDYVVAERNFTQLGTLCEKALLSAQKAK